jgi:MoaA/NifB/PqqE/SkfB family radical SAM enzyme
MRCRYCIYWKWNTHEMNLKEIETVLKKCSEFGIPIYSITGGEPLLRDDICEVLRLGKEYGFFNFLVTNGLLLKEREIRDVDLLTISLDTLDRRKFLEIRGVDAIDRVISAIEHAKNEFETCVNVVLHDHNIDEVERMVKFAEDIEVGITFEPVSQYFPNCLGVDEDKLRVAMKKILELKKQHKYKCIKNSKSYLRLVAEGGRFKCLPYLLLRVDPNGDVISPCYDVEHLRAGNVLEMDVQEIISSYEFRRGIEIARECNRCYLICYVEPSMVVKNIRWGFDAMLTALKG